MEITDDVSMLNEMVLVLRRKINDRNEYKDIHRTIDGENEYDQSGHNVLLPFSRLNSLSERQECRDIIADVIEKAAMHWVISPAIFWIRFVLWVKVLLLFTGSG